MIRGTASNEAANHEKDPRPSVSGGCTGSRLRNLLLGNVAQEKTMTDEKKIRCLKAGLRSQVLTDACTAIAEAEGER